MFPASGECPKKLYTAADNSTRAAGETVMLPTSRVEETVMLRGLESVQETVMLPTVGECPRDCDVAHIGGVSRRL